MKPHNVKPLPIELDKGAIADNLAEAAHTIGQLYNENWDQTNVFYLIAPLEATTSSGIEGTRSTLEDLYKQQVGEATKYSDSKELANYKDTMIEGWYRLIGVAPITINFIKELHGLLLKDASTDKRPGEFRDKQVYVGKIDKRNQEITYVPPEAKYVVELMQNLEVYINENKDYPLIQAALLHYQFEAIHPFVDGNGRMGRLLIPLFLFRKGILKNPAFYISGYFEKNRDAYLDELHKVDETGKYEDWINFFLRSIIVQSKQTIQIFNKIEGLYQRCTKRIENYKSPYLEKALKQIFKRPYFKTRDFKKDMVLPRSTVRRLLETLVKEGILYRYQPPNINKPTYVFPQLIEILNSYT